MGTLAACTTKYPPDDMLELLTSNRTPTIPRLCAFVFGIVILGLGVPVNCVVIKYNLQISRIVRAAPHPSPPPPAAASKCPLKAAVLRPHA